MNSKTLCTRPSRTNSCTRRSSNGCDSLMADVDSSSLKPNSHARYSFKERRTASSCTRALLCQGQPYCRSAADGRGSSASNLAVRLQRRVRQSTGAATLVVPEQPSCHHTTVRSVCRGGVLRRASTRARRLVCGPGRVGSRARYPAHGRCLQVDEPANSTGTGMLRVPSVARAVLTAAKRARRGHTEHGAVLTSARPRPPQTADRTAQHYPRSPSYRMSGSSTTSGPQPNTTLTLASSSARTRSQAAAHSLIWLSSK